MNTRQHFRKNDCVERMKMIGCELKSNFEFQIKTNTHSSFVVLFNFAAWIFCYQYLLLLVDVMPESFGMCTVQTLRCNFDLQHLFPVLLRLFLGSRIKSTLGKRTSTHIPQFYPGWLKWEWIWILTFLHLLLLHLNCCFTVYKSERVKRRMNSHLIQITRSNSKWTQTLHSRMRMKKKIRIMNL